LALKNTQSQYRLALTKKNTLEQACTDSVCTKSQNLRSIFTLFGFLTLNKGENTINTIKSWRKKAWGGWAGGDGLVSRWLTKKFLKPFLKNLPPRWGWGWGEYTGSTFNLALFI